MLITAYIRVRIRGKPPRFIHIKRKSMVCRNICDRYRARKERRSSYYLQGYKRCQTCGVFIEWEGTKCPCCQTQLRSKPHN